MYTDAVPYRQLAFHVRVGAVATLLISLTGAVLLGCSESTAPNPVLTGVKVPMGAGTAFVEVTRTPSLSSVSSIAIVVSDAAVTGLPGTLPTTEFTLALPTGTPATVVSHVGLNWNPMGHPPMGTYDSPHFDAHFYLITPAERDLIVPSDPTFAAKVSQVPASGTLPANYVADPMGIPRMGGHWVDVTSPEFSGQPFTSTLVYGTYAGRVVFLEPMFAQSIVSPELDLTRPIPQPSIYPAPGEYPTSYRIRHDAATSTYRIELLGFVQRS